MNISPGSTASVSENKAVSSRSVQEAGDKLPAGAATSAVDLSGDRDLEWGFVAGRLGRYVEPGTSVLDFGCGNGVLALAAAGLGARVLAIDLMPRQLFAEHPNLAFRQVDVMALDARRDRFDLVMNCSTIEHVGLSGRYNAVEAPDGDLAAMEKLHRLLAPGGHMLLTLPVGKDAVIRPLHRIYGAERLARLLHGYTIVEVTFWRKNAANRWVACPREQAVHEIGHEGYFALGTFVLRTPGD